MSRIAVLAVFVSLFGCGVSQSEVVVSDDGSVVGEELKGGCRSVCPKCHPGEVCPKYACYLSCPSQQNPTCVANAMCIIGYEWSAARCACVPTPGGQKACNSDADCVAVASYCDGCSCSAQATTDPAAICYGTTVNCFADPCMNQTAVCVNGACQLQ